MICHPVEKLAPRTRALSSRRQSKKCNIPRLPQNPKFVVCDAPEVVRHLAAEGFPFFGQGFSKEPQDRIRELLLRRVVAIVGDALVHDGP